MRRSVALALVLLTAIGNFPACSRSSGTETRRSPVALPPDDAKAETVSLPSAPAPSDESASIAALGKGVPVERYNLDAGARALGPGVEPSFTFVRDEIQYQSYPGVMRGGAGAYTSGAANSFDRALLLAELLKRKGIAVRFALGHLPRAEAERLFEHLFDRPATKLGAIPTSGAAAASDPSDIVSRVRARATRDYAAIRASLGSQAPQRGAVDRGAVVAEIVPHAWVQAQVNGNWTDLDPSFPDATAGKTFGPIDRTTAELPAETRQTVTVRVLVDMLSGRTVSRTTALEATMPAADLLDRGVVLVHQPEGASLQGGLGGAIAGERWTPTLWTNGAFANGQAVRFSDRTAPAAHGQMPGGGFGGLFGSGGALGSTDAIVREQLEIEFAAPGRAREVLHRTLFDRAPQLADATTMEASALQPLERDADGLVAPRAVHVLSFSAGRHDLIAYADAAALLRRVAALIEAKGPPADLDFGLSVWPLTLSAAAFFILSDHVLLPAVDDARDCRLYPDAPRLLIASFTASTSGTMRMEYDIRRDALRAVVRNDAAQADAVRRKLWFGVLEGALEHETGAGYAASAKRSSKVAVLSTSAMLDGGSTLRTIDPKQGPPWLARAAAPDAIAVVPASALDGKAPVWWEVNRSNGDTRAMLSSLGGMRFWGEGFAKPSNTTWTIGDPNTDIDVTKMTPREIADSPVYRERHYGPRKAKEEKKGGGNEYLMVVTKIVVAIVLVGAFAYGLYSGMFVLHVDDSITRALDTEHRQPARWRDPNF
ncbi:MAG: hypothetical protein DMF86_11365 [Acidobacteria bacterium]|nr:MAG: hypothetical protein DMF86_11365 [Acidobacteriota bacterium]